MIALKLLDTNANPGNMKMAKTQRATENRRFASLSLFPDNTICPGSKAAGCMDGCLKLAGRGRFENVQDARKRKTRLYHDHRELFMDILSDELGKFSKLCHRMRKTGTVRLNVLSDIAFEDYGIPQRFPELDFYDYTKRAARLNKILDNYRLMFSASNEPKYQKQMAIGLSAAVPVSFVYRGPCPSEMFGRPVIDGDASDWVNVNAGNVALALTAKGPAKGDAGSFVYDFNTIARG